METAIDVAREVKFTSATKIDKINGLVEFGSYKLPELGFTAQVRVRSEGELEVTIRRGSVYIPLPVDKTANEFRGKLQDRLKEAADRTGKRPTSPK